MKLSDIFNTLPRPKLTMLSVAQPPFDKATADVVLASSDGVAFKVRLGVLAEASPIFETICGLPQPQRGATPEEEFEGLPVISLGENSTTLDKILRLCYPVKDPTFDTLDEVAATLEAAIKYEMDEAADLVSQRLIAFAETSPLQVYIVACRHGTLEGAAQKLEVAAHAAAKEIYEKGLASSYFGDMEELSAGSYNRLLYYCRARARGGTRWTDKHTFITPNESRRVDQQDDGDISTGATTEAECPADTSYLANMPAGDIIIRCSDAVDLRVHGIVLKLSSSVLYDEVTAFCAANEGVSPIIELQDRSHIMSGLLKICYGAIEPSVRDTQESLELLAAAHCYKVDKAIQLLSTEVLSATIDPAKLYLLACRFGLAQCAAEAAKRTLGMPQSALETYHPDMENVSAGRYWRLLQYHRNYKEIIDIYSTDGPWISMEWREKFRLQCTTRTTITSLPSPCWLMTYFRVWREMMDHMKDGGGQFRAAVHAEIVDGAFKDISKTTPMSTTVCSKCRASETFILMMHFTVYVLGEFGDAIAKLKLEWK